MNMCMINSNVKIGKNVIINNKALIEHDVAIGNNSYINRCYYKWRCKIGNNVFIGSGSIQRKRDYKI